jgi:hypothetical protein
MPETTASSSGMNVPQNVPRNIEDFFGNSLPGPGSKKAPLCKGDNVSSFITRWEHMFKKLGADPTQARALEEIKYYMVDDEMNAITKLPGWMEKNGLC